MESRPTPGRWNIERPYIKSEGSQRATTHEAGVEPLAAVRRRRAAVDLGDAPA